MTFIMLLLFYGDPNPVMLKWLPFVDGDNCTALVEILRDQSAGRDKGEGYPNLKKWTGANKIEFMCVVEPKK